MISRLVFLLFCGHFAQILGNAGKLPRVKRQSLKVQINATSDAVCMTYIRPSPSTKLEGFILGYGSSFFSNQYIPLPSNGKTYIAEVDAEPRYLIAVRPAPVPNYKKPCSGRRKTPKPLQLVIGNLTPTSVFLSWGILVNPKHDWTTMNNCPNDRFYTVRYREKDKNKKWILQLCPTTETVVDNLKPNTNYEFGVKDNTDNGIWSKIFTHKVVMGGKNKENGQLQNNYKLPKIQTQFIPDSETLVPVQVIKQVLQNITHRTQSEIKSPLSGPILVHLIVPGFNATRQKPPSSSRLDIFEKPKKILAKNKTQEQLAESKTSEVKEITPQSQTASSKMQPVPSEPQTPVPQTIQTKPVFSKRQPVFSSPQTSDAIAIQDSIPAPTETPFTTLKWKPSATPEGWHEKPVSSLPSVKQNIPKTSRITEKLKAPPAEKESQQKTTTSSIFKTSELPRTTMAPRKKKIPVSKPQLLPHLEEPKIAVAVTSKLVPLPATTKISATDGHPVATMVSTGADSFPSKLSTPKLPFTEPASYEPSPLPSISKELDYTRPEEPERKLASFEPSPVPSKSKEPMPEVPERKPVSTEADNYLPKLLTTPELPSTKPDAKARHQVSTPKTTANPQMLHPKPAPKETHRVPTRPKPSSSPGIIPTKSSLKVEHPVPSKPKTPPSQKIPQSKPEIIPFSQDPITTMLPVAPEKTKETFDPKETRLPSSKLKPSDKQEISQTKPASSRPYSTVTTTKTPRLKTVVLRTTPAPARTRTPGRLSWSKMPTGDKLTDEDVAKPLSTSSSTKSSIPLDSSVTRKKPDPVATARTTPIRRRPLPPNTVTGKPGRSGNVLIPRASSFLTSSVAKPTWPSSLVKTNSAKKLPTAAASPGYSNPMFSSLPTTETDIAGTPRYTGDHVKYIQKEEDIPCSITDTLQHFPTEMEDDTDMATSAPQKPPTNLTVVTVEGCPSFIILDWQKPENETVTEYKVVSTENGGPAGKDKSIITTNQTHSTVENLKPNTSYEFVVIASNPLGEGPGSESKPFRTESADPRVTESISMGKDAIWTEVNFNSDDYSECKGKQYVKRTWYKKFVGVQLCNSLRYKIYLSNSLTGTFYNIGDQRGHGEDHCQFVDSYLDGRTGQMLPSDQLPTKDGYFRAVRQEPVHFGKIGAATHTTYVHWYECGTTIPGKW